MNIFGANRFGGKEQPKQNKKKEKRDQLEFSLNQTMWFKFANLYENEHNEKKKRTSTMLQWFSKTST